MKTFAPKTLHGGDLRGLLDDLGATPAQVAKFLHVTERSVWRWLADDSAPFSALAALWHETPAGRYATACDVGNEVVILRGLRSGLEADAARAVDQLRRVLAISDTGAANDALFSGPFRAWPLGGRPVAHAVGQSSVDARRSVRAGLPGRRGLRHRPLRPPQYR